MEKTIEIPEGYEARIEGNKVILEPKESEDERIRKALIRGIESVCKEEEVFTEGFTRKQIVSWLEKQGYAPKYKVGDTIYYNSFGEVKRLIVTNVVTDSTDNPMYEDENGSTVFEKDLIEQNPAWSEEDDEMLKDIIQGLKATEQLIFKHDAQGRTQIQGRIEWFKSRKERYTWKPSDEQMKALGKICEWISLPTAEILDEIRSLYNELKKL